MRPARATAAPAAGEEPATTLPASSQDLRGRIASLESERDDLLRKIAEAETFEAENILDASDEDLDANDRTLIRLRRQATRTGRLLDQATEALRQAQERETAGARQDRYEAAKALCDEAEAWIRGPYAQAATAIRDGLIRIAEIEAAVKAANADLPAGSAPLEIEEFRALPATAPVTRFVPQKYYVLEDGTEVRPTESDPLSRDASGGYWIGDAGKRRVIVRERQVREMEPGGPRAEPQPLATSIRLPRVRYEDPDFWPQRSHNWK